MSKIVGERLPYEKKVGTPRPPRWPFQ